MFHFIRFLEASLSGGRNGEKKTEGRTDRIAMSEKEGWVLFPFSPFIQKPQFAWSSKRRECDVMSGKKTQQNFRQEEKQNFAVDILWSLTNIWVFWEITGGFDQKRSKCEILEQSLNKSEFRTLLLALIRTSLYNEKLIKFIHFMNTFRQSRVRAYCFF